MTLAMTAVVTTAVNTAVTRAMTAAARVARLRHDHQKNTTSAGRNTGNSHSTRGAANDSNQLMEAS